jgi:hypothetical protein
MIQEIVQAKCGILFDFDAFAQWGIPITIGQDLDPSSSLAPKHANGSGSGTGGAITENDQPEDEVLNVEQPTHDQLKAVPAWWLLEIIPAPYTYQNVQDKWVTQWR